MQDWIPSRREILLQWGPIVGLPIAAGILAWGQDRPYDIIFVMVLGSLVLALSLVYFIQQVMVGYSHRFSSDRRLMNTIGGWFIERNWGYWATPVIGTTRAITVCEPKTKAEYQMGKLTDQHRIWMGFRRSLNPNGEIYYQRLSAVEKNKLKQQLILEFARIGVGISHPADKLEINATVYCEIDGSFRPSAMFRSFDGLRRAEALYRSTIRQFLYPVEVAEGESLVSGQSVSSIQESPQ